MVNVNFAEINRRNRARKATAKNREEIAQRRARKARGFCIKSGCPDRAEVSDLCRYHGAY